MNSEPSGAGGLNQQTASQNQTAELGTNGSTEVVTEDGLLGCHPIIKVDGYNISFHLTTFIHYILLNSSPAKSSRAG